MRLLVANANTTEAITQLCADAARAAAAPGTTILPVTPRSGPAVIASRAENALAAPGLLAAIAAEAGAVDGVLLAVSLDTALDAARQIMPCPVVGMTEAACLTACLVGGRFGLATMGATEPYRELIHGRHGLGPRLAGLATVALTPLEAVAEPARAADALEAAVASLVAQGADAVVLGGAALAGLAPALQPRVAVPLLDGIACGVKLLEALVALRLPKPATGSYAAPRGRMVSGIDPALARLLDGS
jgi:allantoin racemase